MEKMQQKCVFCKREKRQKSHPARESARLFQSCFGGSRGGGWGQEEERGGKEWSDKLLCTLPLKCESVFCGRNFFQNVFIPDSSAPRPTVIETGPRIFLAAKYCPSGQAPAFVLMQEDCRESGPPARSARCTLHLWALLPPSWCCCFCCFCCCCKDASSSPHSAPQCSSMELFPRRKESEEEGATGRRNVSNRAVKEVFFICSYLIKVCEL